MPWTTRLAEVSHATCLALARPPLWATTAITACRSSVAGQCCSFLSACHLAENFLHDSFFAAILITSNVFRVCWMSSLLSRANNTVREVETMLKIMLEIMLKTMVREMV